MLSSLVFFHILCVIYMFYEVVMRQGREGGDKPCLVGEKPSMEARLRLGRGIEEERTKGGARPCPCKEEKGGGGHGGRWP